MLNCLKWTKIYGLSYATPQLCKLPLKIFSPFLTGIAKEARTNLTLNWILSLNTSGMKVSLRVSNLATLSVIIVARL